MWTNCVNPECDKGYIWREVGIGENYEATECPDCMSPCPNHIEAPGQNCPTCGF